MFTRRLQTNKILVLFILILIVGGFLRFWGSLHGSFAFTFDVGRDLLAARDIVEGKKLTLIGPTSGIAGLFYGPWWYYLLSLLYLLGGGSPYFFVMMMGVIGLLGILIAYELVKLISDTSTGLLISMMIALSPSFVGTSAQIWSPNLVPPLMLLFFYTVALIERKRTAKTVTFLNVGIGLLIGLILESGMAFGAVFFVSSLLGLFWIYRKKVIFKYVFLGFFTIELPRFVFDLRHNFLQLRAIMLYFARESSRAESLLTRLLKILHLFWESWYLTLVSNPTLNTKIVSGIIAVGVAGILFLKRDDINKSQKKILKFIFINIITIIIGFTIYPSIVWSYYLVGVPVMYILLFVPVIQQILSMSRKLGVLAVLVLFPILMQNWGQVYSSISNPYFKGNASVFRNQTAVVDYIYKDADGKPFNYIAYTPPLIPYTYEYIFWWLEKTEFGYSPSNHKTGLFYLIIENEGSKDAIKEWYLLREGDGKPIWQKPVAGNIIVEKRLR